MEWRRSSLASSVHTPLGWLPASDLAFPAEITSEADHLTSLLGLLGLFVQAVGHPLYSRLPLTRRGGLDLHWRIPVLYASGSDDTGLARRLATEGRERIRRRWGWGRVGRGRRWGVRVVAIFLIYRIDFAMRNRANAGKNS